MWQNNAGHSTNHPVSFWISPVYSLNTDFGNLFHWLTVLSAKKLALIVILQPCSNSCPPSISPVILWNLSTPPSERIFIIRNVSVLFPFSLLYFRGNNHRACILYTNIRPLSSRNTQANHLATFFSPTFRLFGNGCLDCVTHLPSGLTKAPWSGTSTPRLLVSTFILCYHRALKFPSAASRRCILCSKLVFMRTARYPAMTTRFLKCIASPQFSTVLATVVI